MHILYIIFIALSFTPLEAFWCCKRRSKTETMPKEILFLVESAIQSDNAQQLQALIQQKPELLTEAYFRLTDRQEKQTLMDFALCNSAIECIKILKQNNATITIDLQDFCIKAIGQKHLTRCECALIAGAIPYLINSNKQPIIAALELCDTTIFDLLIKYYPIVLTHYINLIHTIIILKKASQSEKLTSIQWLIGKGYKGYNRVDDRDQTILSCAIENGDSMIFQYLLTLPEIDKIINYRIPKKGTIYDMAREMQPTWCQYIKAAGGVPLRTIEQAEDQQFMATYNAQQQQIAAMAIALAAAPSQTQQPTTLFFAQGAQ